MQLLMLLLVFACGDTTPPSWAAGAVLEAEPEATAVRLTWPDPVDDDVLVFVVSVDGVERTRATTSTHTVMISELEDETSYAFTVTAIDQNDNRSTPLSIGVRTLDGTPPEWPEGAELVATSPTSPDVEERAVELAWPAALDATTYAVSREGTSVGRTEATSHQVPDAPLISETSFEVRALDEVGNESEPLTVVWSETAQARREAESPIAAIAPAPNTEARLLGILAPLSSDSDSTLADVLAAESFGVDSLTDGLADGVGTSADDDAD